MAMIPPRKKVEADPATAAPAAATAPAEKPTLKGTLRNEPGPAAEASAAAPAPAATTAVAAAAPSAVSTVVAGALRDIIKEKFKDAMRVEWNTLHRLGCVQGNFVDLEANKAAIGSSLVLQLMNYQDNFQISPGTDDPNDTQYVRYSDDGKTTTMGEDCAEYLRALKDSGYEDAKMGARVTLAGVILECSGKPEMVNRLVQMDLAPTSKTEFDRFRMQTGLEMQRGLKTEGDIETIKLSATLQTKGPNTWTVVKFSPGGQLAKYVTT